MSGRLPAPLTIAEWWKNRRGESIRVCLTEYEGRPLIDLRTWFPGDDGRLKPGKGLSATVKHIPHLAAALAKAEAKARELGLIDGGGADE